MDSSLIKNEVSKQELMRTVNEMTEKFPYRLAGSRCEAEASEYITSRMKEYGLEVKNDVFYTYNSTPISSKVKVIAPEQFEIDSLPCAHIKSTSTDGDNFELVYVGDGSYKAYEDKDVKGKFVLVEVSYAPPVPEKARIAYSMGAAGIMCMNWGNDEEVICCRALKSVWGNPTESTFKNIPEIVGVGITRHAGLKLKELCSSEEKVIVKVTAIADRKWSQVHQPFGILRGNGQSDDFILVCSHLDAWQPGVTCNATGNATTLEICRILSMHRESLDRDIYFVFWDGHEIAEAAGSTWFVDNYWDAINKRCVGYLHIDSTGVSETELYEIKASEELLAFAETNARCELPDKEFRVMPLKKIGDQSFMGIGVPSITERMSFTKEYMEKAHGATLGWWNHTKEDGVDKCDPETLAADTRITLATIYNLATASMLPYDFMPKIKLFKEGVERIADEYSAYTSFSDLKTNIKETVELVEKIELLKENLTEDKQRLYNDCLKQISRQITNITMTYTDKYSQDSYGYYKLSYPIPLFADLERLKTLSLDSLECGMILTQIVKNKNRVNDALYTLNCTLRLALNGFEK